MARAVVAAAALLAVGLWAWPEIRHAIRRSELLGEAPPGRLPVPVEGVEPEEVASTFGDPRAGGARWHEGLDIFASRRTPIQRATRGIVVRRGTNPLGGRTVTILGPGGWRLYYAHLQQWAGHVEG
ncbi:MAG: M23 family metallopeptidase, partial [Gemmatimonadota bacterium]|nr:M23 family metallopeptidase [Gemmatimonadota bacterium]